MDNHEAFGKSHLQNGWFGRVTTVCQKRFNVPYSKLQLHQSLSSCMFDMGRRTLCIYLHKHNKIAQKTLIFFLCSLLVVKMSEIPKIMHQIWFQGQSKLPEKYHNFQASWKRLNPTWKYQLWDEKQMLNFIRFNYPPLFTKVFTESAKLMHQKIDLFKHLVLYKVGGAYLDMDTLALKPLDELLSRFPDKRVLISDGPGNAIEYIASFGRIRMYNNGILLSTPNHPIYKTFIDEMTAALLRGCPPNQSNFKCINNTTGPTIFSKIIDENINKYKDVGLISRNYLEPCHGSDPYCTPEPESISNHRHTLTWLKDSTATAVQAYFTVKHFAPIMLLLIVIFVMFRFRF